MAFVVLLAGLFDRTLSLHLRLTVAAYLALFAVAGHDFNNYWGAIPLMTYPLLFGYGLRSVGGLVLGGRRPAAAGPRLNTSAESRVLFSRGWALW